MRKYILGIILMLGCFSAAFASRPRQLYSVNWEMGTPLGKYTNFVDNFSTRGLSFNAQIFVHENISVGLQLSWHSYYSNKGEKTFSSGNNSAFTGYTYNHLEDIPLAAHVYYHILPNAKVQPYVGVGLGGTYTRHEILIQDIVFEENPWGFGIMPEVGFLVPFGNAPVGLNVFAKYGVSFNKYSYEQMNLSPFQYLNVGIGITFMVNQNKQ